MTDNLNININPYKCNAAEELRESSPAKIEEITVTKTEIKEEVYDFGMSIGDIEHLDVKEEYYSSEENMEGIKSSEQLLNENLVSGNCQLRGEDLQKKQKFSKERLLLKRKGQGKNTLKIHLSMKPDEELKKYKCAYCKYATHGKTDLTRHIRTHTNDKPFKCTYKNCECIAGQEESCKCDMCGYAATGGSNLKKHILMKHSKEPKKYKCADCKYATHQRGDLQRHIRTHTNDRPFKCTYKNCSCTATQEELCKCDMCGFAAAAEGNLNMHILRRHSREPKKYKCADCNYTAHLKLELEQHIRTHTNDRPFKCTYKYCNCISEQKESCKCNPCTYSATMRSHLKRHILKKHNTEQKKLRRRKCSYTRCSSKMSHIGKAQS